MSDKVALLIRLAGLVAGDAGGAGLARRLARACQRILRVDGVAITVEQDPFSRTTLYATDDVASRLENLQDVTGEGPGREACCRGSPVQTGLGGRLAARRWPEFTRSALQAVGPLTVYSYPMRPAGQSIGTISFYLKAGRTLRESTEAVRLLSDAVGARLLRDPPATHPELSGGGWASRMVVHQATGMVMAQSGSAPGDAFVLLRAHAYATDRSLAEIAELVVRRQLNFRPDAQYGGG
jgi:ANTAR domain